MQRRMVNSPCNRCKEKEAARNAHHGRPGRRLGERAPRPDPPAPKGETHARSVPPSVLAHLDVHQCWVEANFAPPAAAAPRKPKNLLMDTVPHCSIPDMPAPVPAALEPSRFPHKILSASPVSAAPTMSAVPPPVSTRRRAGLLRRHWAGASAVVHRIRLTCRWALVWVLLVRDDTGGLSVSRRLVCLCSQRLFNAAGHGVQRWPTMRHQ